MILLTLFSLFINTANAALLESDKQIYTQNNVLKSPGFESGVGSWTASGGSFSATSTAANLARGLLTGSFDSNAAAQTLTSNSKTITSGDGLSSKNGAASCRFKCATGTCTHTINAYDGTNILASTTILSSTTAFERSSVNFIMPTSGTVALRVSSVASNEPQVFIDDCYLGLAEGFNLAQFTQTEFVVSGYFDTTTNCTWTRTNTALGAFSTDADCPGPTVEAQAIGSLQTTDVDLPKFTINNLPPGLYKVEVIVGSQGDTGNIGCISLNDGTTSSGRGCGRIETAADGTNLKVIGYFNYSSSGNRTFEVYGSANSGAIELLLSGSNQRLSFWITKFPLSNQTSFKPDELNWHIDAQISGANVDLGTSNQSSYITPNNSGLTLSANSGSAPVGISCSSTNDNTVGATTCSVGDEEPGFVANFPKAGKVKACFDIGHAITTGATGSVAVTFQVVRTANGSQTIVYEGGGKQQSAMGEENIDSWIHPIYICGDIYIPSAAKHTIRLMYEQLIVATVTTNRINSDGSSALGQRDIHIFAKYIDQEVPAPKLVNSVINSSSGVTAIESATLNCDASSAITSQHGAWISSIGNIASGACAVTMSGGIWSSSPRCWAGEITNTDPNKFLRAEASSSTSLTLDCDEDAGADCTSYDVTVFCTGAK